MGERFRKKDNDNTSETFDGGGLGGSGYRRCKR
jgi:hypothetical protein